MKHAQEPYGPEDGSKRKKETAIKILDIVGCVFVLIWVVQLVPAILCDMGWLDERWNIVIIAVTLGALFCIWLCEKISDWLDDDEEDSTDSAENEDIDGENI